MTHRFELEGGHDFMPLPNLEDRTVVEGLIKEGQTPFMMRQEVEPDKVTCVILPNKPGLPMRGEISISVARQIASIRDELRKLS